MNVCENGTELNVIFASDMMINRVMLNFMLMRIKSTLNQTSLFVGYY